ncbi:hypothetical protein ACLB2K_051827 [Fragaria x ananassa]
MINKIDVDGDGCVDIDEFGELYQSIMDEFGELYQSIMDERNCTRMITKVDVDGDGMVNYKNFKHAGKLMNEFHDLDVVSMGRAYAVWIGVLGFKSHCSQGGGAAVCSAGSGGQRPTLATSNAYQILTASSSQSALQLS